MVARFPRLVHERDPWKRDIDRNEVALDSLRFAYLRVLVDAITILRSRSSKLRHLHRYFWIVARLFLVCVKRLLEGARL